MNENNRNYRGKDGLNVQLLNQDKNIQNEAKKIENAGKQYIKKNVKVFGNNEEFENQL